jgi:class 3 adenylate cyclase/tetratricopeptide (TPR) repeat protein
MQFCVGCGQSLGGRQDTPERDARAYTPKHLADKILQSRSVLEGEHKQLTVLFVDVQRGTELSRTVGNEAWHAILDGFFRVLAEGVHRFEGTINQFTGDGIMALFGAPIAHEDHAQRACYAALHLRDRLRAYTEELKRDQGIDFQTRMGLNSGEVVVGKIGDDLRMDYTAQGEIVNLANRMEQLAEAGNAYLTEHTARLVEGFFDLDDMGPRDVRGVSEPVRAFSLKGAGRLRTRLELAETRGLSRFVGRERELRTLDDALGEALAGSGQIVGVVGEAGVGKSRLCLQFVRACRERGLRVVDAHCPSHGKTEPFGAILQFLRAAFGLREDERDAGARERVERWLADVDPAFDENLPLVFEFLGMPDPERPAPRIDPEGRERRLLRFVAQLVQARSHQEAAVLFLDDAHWIDEQSDRFLAAMAEAVPGTRTLLLVNFRPEYEATWMHRSDYQQLPVRRLGAEDAGRLLVDLLGDDASSTELRNRIHDHTGGNPYFIEEVTRSLAESGALAGAPGAYRLVRPLERLEIPGTVQAVLAGRIDRLGEREKNVLNTAAVIGREVPEPLLARVAGIRNADLAGVLERLSQAEFLYEIRIFPEAVYSFRHPLAQEVAYESQLGEKRSRTHSEVARTIEALRPENLDERAALLAHHWEEAGEALEAARWHQRASLWAGRLDRGQQLAHARRVIALLEPERDRADARALYLDACGRALALSGLVGLPREEADRIFHSGCELSRGDEDLARLSRLHHYYGVFLGAGLADTEGALEHASVAVELADQADDGRTWLAASQGLVQALLYLNRLQEVVEVAEHVLARASGQSAGSGLFLIAGWRWFAAALLGHPREALDALEELLEQPKMQTRLPTLVLSHFFAAHSARLLGDPARTKRHAQRALSVAEEDGATGQLILAYDACGAASYLCEEFEEAAQWSEAALSLIHKNRVLSGQEPFVSCNLARSLAHLGETGRAREATDRALAVSRKIPSFLGQSLGLCVDALLATEGASGRNRIAALLEEAERWIDETGGEVWRPTNCRQRAELARLSGDETRREHHLREAHLLYTEMGATGHAERLAQELEELRSH